MTPRDDRSRARRWSASILLVLIGGAVGWLLYTRRRGQQTLAADPWATPVRTPQVPAEPAAHGEPEPEPEPAAEPDAAAESEPTPEPEPEPEPEAAAEPDAAAESEPESEPQPGDAPFGDGSAAPRSDGSAPEGFDIKGNAGSMLYHPADSPYYGRTKAEVWFRDEASAQAAGFQHWDRKRRG